MSDAEPRRGPRTRTPRTGRRPGDWGSRAAIIDAARRLFATHGYVGTSMRAIGAEAGVDASLIVYFFGTKAQLLGEAVQSPVRPRDRGMPRIAAAGRWRIGAELTRLVVRTWDREGDRNAIIDPPACGDHRAGRGRADARLHPARALPAAAARARLLARRAARGPSPPRSCSGWGWRATCSASSRLRA